MLRFPLQLEGFPTMHSFVKALLVNSAFLGCIQLSSFAGDGPDWLDDPNNLPRGVVTNDNVMIKKDSTPFSLTVQAERSLKSDKPEHAIQLAERALELNPDDADTHMIYAQALERKLKLQANEDPQLFNKCVKEWLSVLRNQFGEEKGTTFRGLGIPGASGRWYEDEDRHRPARQHLIKLTGFSPKPWESNERFLAKVLRSGETSVSAKLLKKEKEQQSGESKPAAAKPDSRSITH